MIGNKPSIYNALSVYNQGGGGFVVVDGVAYTTVKINGLTWTTQNLLYVDPSWSTQGDFRRASIATAPNKRRLVKYGYYYTKDQISYIENNLDLSGFRIPRKEDFEKLLDVPGDELRSTELWPGNNNGTNETGLTLYANGHLDGNSVNNDTSCELWTSTNEGSGFYRFVISDGNAMTIDIPNQSYGIPIRLCK